METFVSEQLNAKHIAPAITDIIEAGAAYSAIATSIDTPPYRFFCLS